MDSRILTLPLLLLALPAGAAEVALDVGHTLADPGAISARGRGEYHFNRALAPVVQQALEARGIKVRPVNYDGKIASLAARPEAARGADLFISLHHDSLPAHEQDIWVSRGEYLNQLYLPLIYNASAGVR